MSRRCLAATLLMACGHRAAPPQVPPRLLASTPPPGAAAGCAEAGAQFDAVLARRAAALTDDARATAEARLPAIRGVTAARCADDGWPGEVARCLAVAADDEPQRRCLLGLRPDQHRRWFLQIFDGRTPPPPGPGDDQGPSCLQIADHVARLTGVPPEADAPPPPPQDPPVELATRWVPQILLERCLLDGWAEAPRACFGGPAPGLDACAPLLPAADAAALRDHLHDMRESLGVP